MNTDDDALIDRLRQEAGAGWIPDICALFTEAADAIERNRQQAQNLHEIITNISTGRRHGEHVWDSDVTPRRCTLCGYIEGDLGG